MASGRKIAEEEPTCALVMIPCLPGWAGAALPLDSQEWEEQERQSRKKNEKIREHKSEKKKEVTRMGTGGKEAKDYNESGGN